MSFKERQGYRSEIVGDQCVDGNTKYSRKAFVLFDAAVGMVFDLAQICLRNACSASQLHLADPQIVPKNGDNVHGLNSSFCQSTDLINALYISRLTKATGILYKFFGDKLTDFSKPFIIQVR